MKLNLFAFNLSGNYCGGITVKGETSNPAPRLSVGPFSNTAHE